MNIIDKYIPLNTKEKIDKLVEELKTMPKMLNPKVRSEIFLNINKSKLQIYFNETYPESMFPEPSCSLPSKKKEDIKPEVTHKGVKPKECFMIPAPKDTLGSKKYIYGTYIEMAFHNMFLTLRHIYALTFGNDIMDLARGAYESDNSDKKWDGDFANEEYVWKPMFYDMRHGYPEELVKVKELIKRHFPMLEAFLDFTSQSKHYKGYSDIDIIEKLSKTLRVLRNVYSHYKINLYENQYYAYCDNEDFINGGLETAFIGSRRIAKARFAFSENQMECTEQYTFTKGKDSYGHPTKIKKEVPGYRYKLSEKKNDGKQHLTAFGLVMLTSLFVEKKYSKILTDKLHLIASADQKVVGEILPIYRIRLHVQRLNVTKEADALALDIINEMQRCPKELFDKLTPELQQTFRVKDAEGDNAEVLMIRHGDRFPQMVMNYIDDAHLFQDIRFQVSLGKYFFKFYDKKCIDNTNETRVRALSKNVNGFGRISDIEARRKAVWDGIIREYETVHKNTADEKPYVTDHHAHYVINGNRIGMLISNSETNNYIPDLTTEGTRNLPPTCWMSTYELPALAFLLHLTDGERVEDIIKSYVANYRKLYTDISQGKLLPLDSEEELRRVLSKNYCIRLECIPQNMQDYLLLKKINVKTALDKHARSMIESMIEQTDYKLTRFRDEKKAVNNPKMNKIGKKQYITIRPGNLAAFLAKDMMLFQPNDPENKSKLTGLNFRILQSVLATYNNGDTESLKRTLTSAHIIGEKGDAMCNPIVMKVFDSTILPGNTIDFYEVYLTERLVYLKQCLRNGNYANLEFIHAGRTQWQEHDADYYKKLAGRYLHEKSNGTEYDKSVELPRRLFEDTIREELRHVHGMEALADDYGKNMSCLIYGYFMRVMGDDCQPFYEAARTYSLLNKLYRNNPRDPKLYKTPGEIRDMLNRKSAKSLKSAIDAYLKNKKGRELADDKDTTERLLSKLKKYETDIKRYKIQDMMLFLIAKRILDSGRDDVEALAFERIKLKDILEKGSLSQKIRMSVRITSQNGCVKNIVQNDLKLKNYSHFYQFLNDRRMPALLDLIQSRTIARDDIEKELIGYDKVHPSILEDVFAYEKKYFENNGEEKYPDFGVMLNNDTTMENTQKQTLRFIRNAFAHSTYPRRSAFVDGERVQIVPDIGLPQKAGAISEKFQEEIKRRR